jgi:hypothetical protein
VTAETSLFDYGPGESPQTFVVPGFPRAPAWLDDLGPEQRAAGEAACASVSEPTLYQWCVFDAGITGLEEFGAAYAQMADFFARGPAALDGEAAALPPDTRQALPSILRVFGSALGPDGMLYLSVEETAGAYAVVALEPSERRVVARADAAYGGEVALSAGSVWVEDFSRRATFMECSLARLDPTTLAVQATVDTPCDLSHTWTATADAVWVIDDTDSGPDGSGALRRIDPVTNALEATSVPLPFAVGFLAASQTTLFYIDLNINEQRGAFRLVPGATEPEAVGPAQLAPLGELVPRVFPAGEGLWIPARSDALFYSETGASFYTDTGDPERTVAYDGRLVAADETQLFVVEREGDDEVLYRYASDGGERIRLSTGGSVSTARGSTYLGYSSGFGALSLLIGRDRVVQQWLVPLLPESMALLIQDTPLP